MPPAIYIHLGHSKTGTSSIQKFCHRYREELKRQLGLCYPLPAQAPYHKHPSLFPFEADQWRGIRREMEAAGCSRLLISHEGWYISGINNSDLTAIRECFPGAEIFFIVYIRRLDDYCRSRYNQHLKTGKIAHPGHAAYHTLLDPSSPRLRPSGLLRRFELQSGREHLLTRIYERHLLKNHNAVDDIFDVMGMSLPDGMERTQDRNQSTPYAALPYMTDRLQRVSRRDPLRKELLRRLSSAFSRPDESGINEALLAGLEEEIKLLDARYLPGYKKLFEKRKCDLSFPELQASPKDVLIVDLLYSILFELRRERQESFSRRLATFACKTAPGAVRTLAAFLRDRVFPARNRSL